MVPVKGMYAPCGLRSKVVVLVMLMYCFFIAPIVCRGSVFGPCFVI